jgi:hypothetical protein
MLATNHLLGAHRFLPLGIHLSIIEKNCDEGNLSKQR